MNKLINPRAGHGGIVISTSALALMAYSVIGFPGLILWGFVIAIPCEYLMDWFKISMNDYISWFYTSTLIIFATIGIYIDYKVLKYIWKWLEGEF